MTEEALFRATSEPATRGGPPLESVPAAVPQPRKERLLQIGVEKDWLYAAVVQSVSDAVITKSLDGKITGWNRAAERMFGFTAGEAIGQSIGIIVPPECRDEIDRLIEHSAKGDYVDHYETIRRTKDGQILDVSLSVSPIRSQSGESIGAAKIVRDITEQKFIERKFELAVEACPSGILMIDGSGIIVLVNAELERQFGYDRSELIGNSLDVLLPIRPRQAHALHRTKFNAAPAVRAMGAGRDLYGRRKDGSEFSVEIGLNPIKSVDCEMILTTVIDITSRKQAERAIEAQNAQLRRSNAELEQFAYMPRTIFRSRFQWWRTLPSFSRIATKTDSTSGRTNISDMRWTAPSGCRAWGAICWPIPASPP
jgi:PAS domain S-box-containing protein